MERKTIRGIRLAVLLAAQISLANIHAQSTCEGASSQSYLHGNHIRALIDASGSLFWDGNESQFTPQFRPYSPSTIFAQALWLSGQDEAGNIKVTAPRYGKGSGLFDYFPGPIPTSAPASADYCEQWDKVWIATRLDVETHLADLADNGIIDNPQAAIMGWPGRNNPHFASMWGFELPENEDFAPFTDTDENGIYDPLQGDYPSVPQSGVQPDQITWCVFNDSTGTREDLLGDSVPLGVDVQLTAWAFLCEDNPILNTTLFTSYKIINKSGSTLLQLKMADWIDFDLGCYTDDYLGCSPEQNTFFAYNGDNIDGTSVSACEYGIYTFGENPPVQAITFLNKPMASFTMYDMGFFAPNIPVNATSVNYLMNSLFADGTPITPSGRGYNPESTLDPVPFIFPGNPNLADEWSAYGDSVPAGDWSCIASAALGDLAPGQAISIDLAYSFHREPMQDHLGNITVMYSNVDQIQAAYDTHFSNQCVQSPLCVEDCIWAGDLNADGIANHCDLLPIAGHYHSTGPIRQGPYNWQPQNGLDWQTAQFNEVNNKHIDANGSGLIDEVDFEMTLQHYGLTQPGYTAPPDVYRSGNELGMAVTGDSLLSPNELKSVFILANSLPEGTVGIAFSVEIDPAFLRFFIATTINNNPEEYTTHTFQASDGQYDIAYIAKASHLFLEDEMARIVLRAINDFSTLPSDRTTIRIKNSKAILADGTEIPIGAESYTFVFEGVVANEDIPEQEVQTLVFPNPAKDQLQVQSPFDIERCQLLNLQGQVQQVPTLIGSTSARLDVHSLPAGMYWLILHANGKQITKRVVILK